MTKTKAKPRTASLNRKTKETQIRMTLNLDGSGKSSVRTTIPFMDHMLDALAKHARFDLIIKAKGDTHMDDHHLVEDLGIAFGEVLSQALGDKKGITRFGQFLLPMDESLSYVAIDLSGRPYFVYKVKWIKTEIKKFDAFLIEHFFESVASHARMNLHMALQYGKHPHHIAECLFKGFARALSMAVQHDPRVTGIPSTKGTL